MWIFCDRVTTMNSAMCMWTSEKGESFEGGVANWEGWEGIIKWVTIYWLI